VIYYIVALKDDKRFHNYLFEYLHEMNAVCYFVSDPDKDKPESIFVKYNAGIRQCINEGLKPDDVVAFIHEDVKLLDPAFLNKVSSVFDSKSDVGMLGVAGTSVLTESGAWWHNAPDLLRGHVIQEHPEGGARHLIKGPIGFFDDLVAVDGLCFFIRGKLFTEENLVFDDKTYDGYHFYDIDTSLQVLEKGYKVACADILLQHGSVGNIKEDKKWHENRDKLISKWKNKGVSFPLTNKHFIKNDTIIEVDV
jgi:hypothetical protein